MTNLWLEQKKALRRRQARPGTCRRCGAETLTGDNYDDVAISIRVDLPSVTWLEEIAAVLTGRLAAELIDGELHQRDPWQQNRPARHPVHLTHHCPEGTTR